MKQNFKIVLILLCLVFIPIIVTSQAFKPLTLDKIYQQYSFYANTVDGLNSMADGEHYSVLEDDKTIVIYDYKTGKERYVVFDAGWFPDLEISNINDYEFSTDESRILLTVNKSMIYRHSFEADYFIFDRITKKMDKLSDNGKQQLASFSPNGKKVAFVKDNNLFIKNLDSNLITQITFDGEHNKIINGAPDWVYEEEFSFSKAYCWSPDSKSLAFYKFDESRVKEYDIEFYNGLYPQIYSYKYPKAGEDNSIVNIYVYDVETNKMVKTDIGENSDQYIPRIKWTASPNELCIVRLNRLQNHIDVILADRANGQTKNIFSEDNQRFIPEIDDNYISFTADQRNFIIRSERTGFFHYYLYTIEGKYLNAITHGNWEVMEVLGIDEKNNMFYYTSTEESPLQRDVYKVKFDGSRKTRMTQKSGTNEAEFSKTFRYYINTWSNANTPPQVAVYETNGTYVRMLENNLVLTQNLKEYGFTKKEFISIPVSPDIQLNAYLVKPPDFDSTKKYPLFIYVYGGPESQEVTDSWDNGLAWQELLAQHGIVVACIDNRGTDGRGEEFKKCTYLQLGKYETEDQINAAKYLGNLKWIDKNRIGVWGWSYGGYMTLLCLTKGADVFKMGVAVAPVTNWRFYDTIYTERFMRSPKDNASGYDDNSPINFADELKGHLLMIHGTGDDNVHFQNSVEMVDRLIKENKQFDVFYYPNRNHGIYGGNTRMHLYTMITDYVFGNL